MNTWDRDQYGKAWQFATIRHTGQTYGGRQPEQQITYINHLASVAMEITWVMQHSAHQYDADLAIACALLHDTLEDTPTSYEELQTEFGKKVADGVMALTKNIQLSKSEQMQDSLSRIKQQPKEVWLVKMADRVTNLYHPPYYWNDEKISSYLKEADVIYQALHSADALLAARLKEKMEQYSLFLKNKLS